jgi:hypothetical protein
MHSILSSIKAEIGMQLKQSVNIFQILREWRLLHSSKNPYNLFTSAD